MGKARKINVNDKVEARDSLDMYRRWFNGMKKFLGVKLAPKPLE